eukprot:PhF_6_TR652/c1_g1_i2/m.943
MKPSTPQGFNIVASPELSTLKKKSGSYRSHHTPAVVIYDVTSSETTTPFVQNDQTSLLTHCRKHIEAQKLRNVSSKLALWIEVQRCIAAQQISNHINHVLTKYELPETTKRIVYTSIVD